MSGRDRTRKNNVDQPTTFKFVDYVDDEPTQSINMGAAIPGEISRTGSFNVKNLRLTQFGKFLEALNIPFLVVSPDPKMKIEFVSERWERICPGTRRMGEVSFASLFSVGDAALHARQIAGEVVMTRKPVSWNTSIKLKDREIWGRLDFLSIKLSGTRFVLVTLQDMTFERRRLRNEEDARTRLEDQRGELVDEVLDLEARLSSEETRREKVEQQLHSVLIQLDEARNSLPVAVLALSEKRDPVTARHHRRVTALAALIGQRMRLERETLNVIRLAASVHDIGKLVWPDNVLKKKDKAGPHDWNVIRQHPSVGYDVLRQLTLPARVADIVLQHHEMMNGSGYPQGLDGKRILVEARVIRVADAVEAMASPRPWRQNNLSRDQIIEELLSNCKPPRHHYDNHAASACVSILKEGFAFQA